MMKLGKKEVSILKFIRRSRHKATIQEIADGLGYSFREVGIFIEEMVNIKLLNHAIGPSPAEDAYYTNPEKREEIYDLIG